MEIEISSNIPEKIRMFGVLRVSVLKEARRSGLSSAGFFITKEMRKWIESQGGGSWAEAHPMTQIWKKDKSGKWTRRRGQKPYEGLGKFARYIISYSAFREEVGFGTFSGKKQGQFSPVLTKIAREAQKNRSFTVTPKMRRKLGSQRQSRKDLPGKDFFPLKQDTAALHIPSRPISTPVFQKIKAPMQTIFAEKFGKAFSKRYERL